MSDPRGPTWRTAQGLRPRERAATRHARRRGPLPPAHGGPRAGGLHARVGHAGCPPPWRPAAGQAAALRDG
eukprot:7557608-Alexandrium_andersonii.AAC.1